MEQLLNLINAAKFLGISRAKMSLLVRERAIPFQPDPLDKRKKLFRSSDLQRIKEASDASKNN